MVGIRAACLFVFHGSARARASTPVVAVNRPRSVSAVRAFRCRAYLGYIDGQVREEKTT